MMPRRAHGLTLLELVTVLAVLAVLASLALPSLGDRLQRQRLQAAAEGLAADITDARFEAARRGQPLFIETRPGAAWCWAVATTSGCDCATAPACQVHSVQGASHRGVRLLDSLALRLDPAGTAQVTGPAQGAVLATPRGERLRVSVSALGRAQVCALSGAWPRLPRC